MEALRKMMHLCNGRCTLRALMSSGQKCFAGADPEANRAPLIDMARNGDQQYVFPPDLFYWVHDSTICC